MNRITKEHGSYYCRSANGDALWMADELGIVIGLETDSIVKIGRADVMFQWLREQPLGVPQDMRLLFGQQWEPELLNHILEMGSGAHRLRQFRTLGQFLKFMDGKAVPLDLNHYSSLTVIGDD